VAVLASTQFRAQWRAPVPHEEAIEDLREYVFPLLQHRGFQVVEETDEEFVLERRMHPLWTIVLAVIVFPLGLLALLYTERERMTVELTPDGDETGIIAAGSAPRAIRRALRGLERSPTPVGTTP
jgi:hypothetical protein